MQQRFGFTLIELMIVVAIVAIIAAIAVPALLGSKKSANEASAISSLRTINTACQIYHARNNTYPPDLTTLFAAGLIDATLASGSKSGYSYGSLGGGGDGDLAGGPNFWRCYAEPVTPGQTGDRFFRINGRTGVIRYSANGLAPWIPLN